jgi:hypothetical protein
MSRPRVNEFAVLIVALIVLLLALALLAEWLGRNCP